MEQKKCLCSWEIVLVVLFCLVSSLFVCLFVCLAHQPRNGVEEEEGMSGKFVKHHRQASNVNPNLNTNWVGAPGM